MPVHRFLLNLQSNGIRITPYADVAARLEAAHDWRYAFRTLLLNGRRINIRVDAADDALLDGPTLSRLFSAEKIPSQTLEILLRTIQGV